MNASVIVSEVLRHSASLVVVFALVWACDALAARAGGGLGLPSSRGRGGRPRATADAGVVRGVARLRSALWLVFLAKLVAPLVGVAWATVGWTSSVSAIGRVSLERALGTPLAAFDGMAPSARWGSALVVAVALIAGSLGAVAIVRAARARARWRRASEPAPAWLEARLAEMARVAGLRRAPRIRVGTADAAYGAWSGAVVIGFARPAIVVSSSLVEHGPGAALEHVLWHELAHVVRRDAWQDALWTAARCAYWFHPCVHAAASRAALLREMAADERAASWAGGDARAYRRTLLELARPLVASPVGGPSYFGRPAQILARLDGLARLERVVVAVPRRFDPVSLAALAVLSACCLPSAAPRSVDDLSSTALAAPSFTLEDAQGCLQKRYLVLLETARLARDETGAPPARPTTGAPPAPAAR